MVRNVHTGPRGIYKKSGRTKQKKCKLKISLRVCRYAIESFSPQILLKVLPQGIEYAKYAGIHLGNATGSMNCAIYHLDNMKAYLTSVTRGLERCTQRQIQKIRNNEDVPSWIQGLPLIGGLVTGVNQIVNEQTTVRDLRNDLDRKTKTITDIINKVKLAVNKSTHIKSNLRDAILSAVDVESKIKASSVLTHDLTIQFGVRRLTEISKAYMNKYKPQIDRYNQLKDRRLKCIKILSSMVIPKQFARLILTICVNNLNN